MPLFFTPADADKLLPDIQRSVAYISMIRKSPEMLGKETEMADMLQREIRKLEELGCTLKDFNIGLVDFPAVRLGVRVWLCWKPGEKEVEFWHGLNEGFANRKPVNDESEFYADDVAVKSLAGEISSLTRQHL